LRADPVLAAFAETLAEQCALNEYVWSCSAEDRTPATPQASFADPTSRQVAQQYEHHPFPAWRHIDPAPEGSQLAHLRALQQNHGLAQTPDGPRVLIAGCGTGQQVVQMAATLGPHARIVACDLSAASLAYAKRKATEHGIDGVDFRQADILDLATWSDRFDIVACTGVLHHMKDPRNGWRILTELTVPGGAHYIALYSARARVGLDDIRRRFPPDDALPIEGRIREFRRRVLEAHAFDWASSGLTWTDFFTMGGCRDLLFHAHEDRYTIPRIADDLAALGLRFLDFALPSSVAPDFSGARDDLAAWDDYERAHPHTFTRMYQFWCAKPA
jgi:SAM-dependent methyltransferase